MDLSNFITPEVIQSLVGLISMGLAYAIHVGTAYFKTKTKNEKIKTAIGIMDTMLVSAVKSTEQTYKKNLIKSSPNGKLTEMDKQKLLKNVLNVVQENLTQSAKKEILKVIPDIKTYARVKVEEIIHDVKASKFSPPIVDNLIDSHFEKLKNVDPAEIMNGFGLGK